jgi:hypothetical protein
MELTFRPITKDELLSITLTAEEEEIPVRGQFASDDEAADKELEDSILDRMRHGDEWAWFCAKVEVVWNGYKGQAFLGACSYENEADFKKDGYYEDMVEEALEDLNKSLATNFAVLKSRIEMALYGHHRS